MAQLLQRNGYSKRSYNIQKSNNQVHPPPDLESYLLRHTFCTDCQVAGVPLNVAKELMGHSDISVTAKIYTHMVDEVFEQNRKRLAEYATFKEQRKENA